MTRFLTILASILFCASVASAQGLYLAPYVGSGTDADPYRPDGTGDQFESFDLRLTSKGPGYSLVWLNDIPPSSSLIKIANVPGDNTRIADRAAITLRLGQAFTSIQAGPFVKELLDKVGQWQKLQPVQDPNMAGGRREFSIGNRVWFSESAALTKSASNDPSDNFNRADGGLGTNWTTTTGQEDPQIVSNLVQDKTAGVAPSQAWWNANTFAANQYSQATNIKNTVDAAHEIQITVRIDTTGANTAYQCRSRGPNGSSVQQRLGKIVTGTPTVLASGNFTINDNDVIRCEVIGSALNYKQNGTSILTATDSAISSGAAGFGIVVPGTGTVTDTQLDDWSGDSLCVPSLTLIGVGAC